MMLAPEVQDHIRIATSYLTEHQLRQEKILRSATGIPVGAIWQIGRPGTSCYFAEVIATPSCGALVVHGDVETCRFAAADRDPLARLGWMGNRHPNDFSYPAEKARIGMGGDFLTSEFSESAARRQVLESRREGIISAAAARAAFGYLEECCPTAQGLHEVMEPHDPDYWDHPFGQIYSFNLVASVVILRKCYELVSPGYAARNYWARSPW